MSSAAAAAALHKKWKDIRTPGAFSSAAYFYRGLESAHKTGGKSQVEVKRALEKDIAYQTGRVLRKNFPRRRDLAYYFSERWETDLGDIGPGRFVDLKSQRELGRYFLLIIDVFSKKVFARGLTDKKGATVGAAFRDIIDKLQPPYTLPLVLESDQGKEFVNKPFLVYLRQHAVQAEWARGGNKARTAERAVRSFKKVLIPYLETRRGASWDAAVRAVADSLNRRYNRSVGMSPNQVLIGWRRLQERNLAESEAKRPFDQYLKEHLAVQAGKREVRDGWRHFSVGDKVIIPYRRQVLDKESDRQFTYQVYEICGIWTDKKPYLFRLQDGRGVRKKRLYYGAELRHVKPPKVYPYSEILKTRFVGRKKYMLVRFLDHGASFDEWLPASQLLK